MNNELLKKAIEEAKQHDLEETTYVANFKDATLLLYLEDETMTTEIIYGKPDNYDGNLFEESKE